MNRPSEEHNSCQAPGNNGFQMRKSNSSPAWGSGAICGQVRPQLNRKFSSPPHFSPSPYSRPPPQPQIRNRMYSPRHYGHTFNRGTEFGNNNGMFRTPQPMYNRGSLSPRKSWSCDNHFRPVSKRLNMKSPRQDFNCNPGGSNDINQYYHPSMLADPWLALTPIPVLHTPAPTT